MKRYLKIAGTLLCIGGTIGCATADPYGATIGVVLFLVGLGLFVAGRM